MSVENVSQVRRNELFRFGQPFTYSKIQFMYRRTPYAKFWVRGIIDESLGKKFRVVDKGTENDVSWNTDLWNVLNKHWKELMKTIEYERAYGKSLLTITEHSKDANKLVVRPFSINNYEINYTDESEIEYAKTTQAIGGMKARPIPTEFEEKDIWQVYELLIRETETKGNGISSLEMIWDTLFALQMLDEHSTYFVIRVGGGLKLLKIPEDKLNDDDYMAKITKMGKETNSGNGVMIIPYSTIGGATIEDTSFELVSGDLLDFISIRDLLLGSLSAATGIPREVFLGSELGLRSAETNQSAYFTVKQNIRDEYREFLEWVILLLNKKYNFFTPDADGNFDFDFIYYSDKTLDEKESLEIVDLKLTIAQKLGYTVAKKEIESMIGIKLEEKEEIEPIVTDEDNTDDTEDNTDEQKTKTE